MKAWLARLRRFRPTGLRHLDRYVLQSWIRIFVLTALGFPLVSIVINLTDTPEPVAGPRSYHEGDRRQLHLLHPGERVHRDAGGGALCHRVHGRRDGPALRSLPRPRREARASTG